jgi:signal transduction histidine kinase/CheY-like chemotaxis protein
VLVVQHYEDTHAYGQRDLEFLMSVGSQIALAIERKQAEHALQDANQRALTEYESLVERMAALGQTLGNARDLAIIFRALRDFASASVPCDGVVISLYDREKKTRRPAYLWTDNKEFDTANLVEIPVKDGLTGTAISSGSVIIDNNFQPVVPSKHPVFIGEHDGARTPHSALSAPMTVMGRTVGCIEIQSYQGGSFEQEHATAMRMAANLAANAVENVILIEREQAKEEQLRQAQKMESIGTLAGGIAHDFNNLMTAVTGYSELALRSLSADDPLRPKIEVIKSAGERATGLTRQLLAFSRKQMLQPKVLDLNSVISGIAQMLPRVIGEHIDLSFSPGDPLGQIKADPSQIEQVLLNLAVNARDAMPECGRLTIETRNVHLTGKFGRSDLTVEPGHYVMMAVSDTGTGMDDETQSHIFEPFFTTKGVGKGTGLGLSTVYGIVKQSGGSLVVQSELGKGTTFKIYLPRVDEITESEAFDGESAEVARGQETVLLVEDEEVVRNLSREILETYGYSVLVAANGREGLRVGEEFQGKIDLVITDVIMPLMGGPEMTESLRTSRPDTRVLFMSGFTDDAIVHHGVLDESVSFLQKPFSLEALASKAREVLDQA